MSNKKITIAKTAGFCFGVSRAIDLINSSIDKKLNNIKTLGPIIHNKIVVDEFKKCKVDVIEDYKAAKQNDNIIIRSHGVEQEVYSYFEKNNIKYIDATCPFVQKIHNLVSQVDKGDLCIIMGDKTHPEIIGIIGHCKSDYIVIKDLKELKSVKKDFFNKFNDVLILSQTTFNKEEWNKSLDYIKNICTKLQIFDTICSATSMRQQEAASLASENDLMIIVGDKSSSNTQKLYSICKEKTKTIWVEDASELKDFDIKGIESVAITAGASTPKGIIKEVHDTMSEILENQEMSFDEMLDASFKSVSNGDRVKGVVTAIHPNEIHVDIGTKHAGFVPLSELTDDPSAKPEDIVRKGDELELLVVRVNDVEGTVMLSKKRFDAQAGFEKVVDAANTDTTFKGVVTEVIKGGILALTNGVKVFIPASQTGTAKDADLKEMLKKEVSFKILEANRQRKRAVGSVKSVAKELKKELEEKFWTAVEEGQKFTGKVKSLTNYGAFVDLGGVDGMVHISELSWGKIRHPSQILKVGDEVSVFVKSIDKEKKRISLGYKKDEDNPWEKLKSTYNVDDVADVKVVSVTAFGAFAELIPGIDGLIHISQLSNKRVAKPADVVKVGDVVKVKITEIDYENQRVSLSIRALLPEEPKEGKKVEEKAEEKAAE